MNAYLKEHAPTRPSKDWIADMAGDILQWWGDKALSEVNGRNCRAYLEWRTAQPIRRFTKSRARNVSEATVWHELKTLRAAINYYHKEHGPLLSVPAVTLPPKAPPRIDYFWIATRLRKRIRAARRRPETHHLVRLIVIGYYTGTRPGAILKLHWEQSPRGGWIDVDKGIIHRQAYRAVRTRKEQPPARIHDRLMPHLRAWRRADVAKRIGMVIHYEGAPVKRVRRSWATVRKAAGYTGNDSPHILRHTAATWYMQRGLFVSTVAGYLGMSAQVLQDVYGHHHPEFQKDVAQSMPKKDVNRSRTK